MKKKYLFLFFMFFSHSVYAGMMTGYINVSVTIMPSGNQCGTIGEQGLTCSVDTSNISKLLKDSPTNNYKVIKEKDLVSIYY